MSSVSYVAVILSTAAEDEEPDPDPGLPILVKLWLLIPEKILASKPGRWNTIQKPK